MRNHSHRSMKRLKPEGGSAKPRRGRVPRGAKNSERNPASSSIPSDWYDEKSWRTAMHERNSSVLMPIIRRGLMLTTISSDARSPMTNDAVSAASLALSQNSDGAYHTRRTKPKY